MKFKGRVKSVIVYDKFTQITLETESRYVTRLREYQDDVLIDIKDYVEDKTSRQLRYIWALIDKIDKKVNGFMSDSMEIYTSLLKQANVKSEYYEAIPEAEAMLKKAFRVVELVEEGKEKNVYRCHLGLSKLNKKEISSFIEALIQRCVDEGIEYDYEMERIMENERAKRL